VSYKTIKTYLAAIRVHHIEHSIPDPTTDDLLHLVCRGICSLQGESQRIRLPISINLLHIVKEHLHQSTYTVQEQRMLWAAFTIAFYGLLRVGELTSLQWSDIAFSPDQFSISLCQSKTDPFRRGCTIKIFSTSSSTCPYHSLDRYHRLSDTSTPCAYMFQSGRFHSLSRVAVTNTLRQPLKQVGLNYSQCALHSFRIGAATSLAAAG